MDQSLLEAVIEHAPTAMVMIDADGIIVLINHEAERLFGYGRLELIGRAVEALVPPRFRDGHANMRDNYLQAAHARRMGVGRELFALRKDLSEVPVEIGLNPIHTEQGTLVLSAIVDISERLRLEDTRRANLELEQRVQERTAEIERHAEQLRMSNQALERSNIELQQFAYVASHDLQSPLRSISGFMQLLERKASSQLDEQARHWIRSAAESTQRLSMLIRDLLEVSGVDSRAQSFVAVSLDAALDDALALLGETLDDSAARIERAGTLPHILGDRSQLAQLFQNLLGNAIKYCGADAPRIEISAEPQGAQWCVCVRDHGIGIDVEHHERVFEIFRRLHSQKAYPGTGLGLAVCRRVVSRHGGRIWVESPPGRGCSMKFTLPAIDEESTDGNSLTQADSADPAG
jgi:PAS domain S-box-containing protein